SCLRGARIHRADQRAPPRPAHRSRTLGRGRRCGEDAAGLALARREGRVTAGQRRNVAAVTAASGSDGGVPGSVGAPPSLEILDQESFAPPCHRASNGALEETRALMPSVTKALAVLAASSGVAPLASSAVTAAASEQPA